MGIKLNTVLLLSLPGLSETDTPLGSGAALKQGCLVRQFLARVEINTVGAVLRYLSAGEIRYFPTGGI